MTDLGRAILGAIHAEGPQSQDEIDKLIAREIDSLYAADYLELIEDDGTPDDEWALTDKGLEAARKIAREARKRPENEWP